MVSYLIRDDRRQDMRRRKNGEGSYGKKNINGIQYYYYKAPNNIWTVYAKTSKELEEKKKAKEDQDKLIGNQTLDEITTFSTLADVWLTQIRSEISPSTFDAYEDIINVRIKKYQAYDLANKQVQGITINILESYLNTMKEKYAKASIDKTWIVIKQILKYGQDCGYVPSNLDLTKVKKPKERDVVKKKKEIQFITLEDINILYNESLRTKQTGTPIYGDGARVLCFIMYSGLRIGEAIGLTWKYVSKDYSEIKVLHSSRRVVKRGVDGKAVIEDGHKVYENFQKGTKTHSGERIVPLPDRAMDILRYFCEKYPNHTQNDYVFLTKNGNVFDRKSLEKTLQALMNNSECSNKEYTPHSLRHGYGSILLSQGVDIKTVSVLLGHKDISTTYNIYIHVLEDDKRKAVTNVFNKI